MSAGTPPRQTCRSKARQRFPGALQRDLTPGKKALMNRDGCDGAIIGVNRGWIRQCSMHFGEWVV
jgi:hypothetical protein